MSAGGVKRDVGKSPNVPARNVPWLDDPMSAVGVGYLEKPPKKELVRYALKKKTILFGNFSQHGGRGVFPNPKTFVNLPSIFLYAKFILRC